MKKLVIIVFVSCLFSLNAFSRQPVLSVEKHGGHRVWITFWKVTYNTVIYSSCDGSLLCRGEGNNSCHAPGIISQSGNGYEIGDYLFSDELISGKLNFVLDEVDLVILQEDAPASGTLSKTFALYDLNGILHYVVFSASWSDSDWKTGDAKINITMSVILE